MKKIFLFLLSVLPGPGLQAQSDPNCDFTVAQ